MVSELTYLLSKVWISDGVDKYNFMDSRTGHRGTETEGQGQRDRDRGSEGQKQRDRNRRTKYGLPMSVERPTECNMALA